jgi:putative transposase
MKKSKFTETQIVSILKQADAGVPIKDICRQAGISVPTYYQWKSKYGGMEASDLKRVKELEAENARLKRTTGRSFWAKHSPNGPKPAAWPSSTSSPASPTRTPTSNASTAPSARRCSTNTCLLVWKMCVKPLTGGWSTTTSNVPTNLSAI